MYLCHRCQVLKAAHQQEMFDPHHIPMVSRDEEVDVLKQVLKSALSGAGSEHTGKTVSWSAKGELELGGGGLLMALSGEAGVGKTKVVEEIQVNVGPEMGMQVVVGRAQSTESTSLYYCWRDIFSSLIRSHLKSVASSAKGASVQTRMVRKLIDEDFHGYAALLNDILGTEFSEGDEEGLQDADKVIWLDVG